MRHVTRAGLAVADVLADFVEAEALPGTGVEAGAFWDAFAAIVRDLAPRNRELLSVRDRMQARIDEWHRANRAPSDMAAYRGFLKEIGYLVDEGPDFRVETSGVDAEIGRISGPQLVVPVMNARFALNAANARWGSLYDALYGTDAIGEDGGRERGGALQPGARGGRRRLDAGVPRRGGAPPRCRLGGRARVQGGGRHAGRRARRRRDGARAAGAARGLPRRRGGAEGDPPPQQRARDPGPHRPGHAERAGRPGARLRRLAGGGGDDDHRLRGLRRRGRRAGQGASSTATGSA